MKQQQNYFSLQEALHVKYIEAMANSASYTFEKHTFIAYTY